MRKFQEQYSEVVRNQASVTLKITKCTTIGPPRIGKTCLKNLLIGQEWDVEAGTASTDVMEAPEWVECYSLEKGGAEKPWKLLSAEQQQGELIRAVNSLTISNIQVTISPSDATPNATPMNVPATTTLRDAQPTTKPSDAPPTTKPSDAPPTTEFVDATTTPSYAPPTATSSDVQQPTRPTSKPPPPAKLAQKPATVLQALEALAGACSSEALQDFLKDKQGKVLGETRLVHFIDTGGQAIYHDVHPVLITSPSVYLVVFSLSELCKKSPEECIAYFRSGFIQRPLRSIYTFGTKAPQKEDYVVLRSEAPKILVVGTHLDQVPLEDSGMERFLDDISRMIEKEISNKPYRQFVQYDTKGRSFWAVDNTLAGREQSEGVKRYNTDLRRMVQEGSTEMSVKVPLPWMLLKVVMDGMGVHYCKYSELLEEARSRGYVREDSPNADLDTMLWLFHILGLIYHKMPKGCKKEDSLVFIDPDCLYSATSDFLMAAKEEIEDSREAQHQIQAASTEKTKDNHREAVKRANTRPKLSPWRKLRTTRETVRRSNTRPKMPPSGKLRTIREAVRRANTRPQPACTEETEDGQGDSEEVQHQTQAASTKETKDNHREAVKRANTRPKLPPQRKLRTTREAVRRSNTRPKMPPQEKLRTIREAVRRANTRPQSASTEETEDGQGDSEEVQHQTQAASTEETEDNQGGSEEVQHQTQAASTEETEDNQGGSEEVQHQTQAASMEETEDKHREAVKRSNTRPKLPPWRKLRTTREAVRRAKTRPKLPPQRKLRTIREAVRRSNKPQLASTEETEDNQRSSEEVQHQTQAASSEEMFCDKGMAGGRGRQQKQEANGIVQKRRVIERIQCNSESIKNAIEAELQTAEQAIKQEAPEDVMKSLHDQLEKIEERYKLPAGGSQVDAASVKAKQQLYIRRMVKSLASSVKAVLGDTGRNRDVHCVRREVGKAVESIRRHYQGRSIVSRDMDQVLSILSDLRIVAKLSGSDRYVVPAALPEVPHLLNISGSADPILVTVVSQTIKQVCFLPSGLFCCLISELVTKLGWTVEPLGRTHVAFTHKDLTGVVHVVEHESYIEIKLESLAPLEELPKTCQNVRTKIHRSIVYVYKTLYSDPTADSAFEDSLVWGFRCEEHPGDDTHIAAFRKIADDEYWTECLLEPLNVLDIEPEQLVWFS